MMIKHILGTLLEPLFTCFSELNIDGNYFQSVILIITIFAVFSWVYQLCRYN